jgi:hypothetical protein
MSIISALLLYGCEEEIETFETKNEEIGLNPPHNDHEPVDTSNRERVYLSETSVASNTCVSVTSGKLEFDDKYCFSEVYKSIMNKTSSTLNTWEANLGGSFISLYTYYDQLEQDSTYDDYESDSLRTANMYLERLLNDDAEFIIDDSTYFYDFANERIIITDNQSGLMDTISLASFTNKRGLSCTVQSVVRKGEYSGNSWMLKMEKVTGDSYGKGIGLAGSEVYFTITHYRKNTLGIWKKKVDRLNSYLDRWNYFKAERTNCIAGSTGQTNLTDQTYNDKEWTAKNEKQFQWVLHYDMSNLNQTEYTQWCVYEWGRHHVYIDYDIMNDVHHAAW